MITSKFVKTIRIAAITKIVPVIVALVFMTGLLAMIPSMVQSMVLSRGSTSIMCPGRGCWTRLARRSCSTAPIGPCDGATFMCRLKASGHTDSSMPRIGHSTGRRYLSRCQDSGTEAPSNLAKRDDAPTYHKLPRVYINTSIQRGTRLAMDDDIRHYLSTVLRLSHGDHFRAFNEIDGEFLCELQLSTGEGKRKKSSVADAEAIMNLRQVSQQESRFPCILYFSPLKKKERTKLLIEKAVEIGVNRLVPVICPLTQVHDTDHVVDSWRQTIIESCEQSERLTIPQLFPAMHLNKLLSMHFKDVGRRPILVCRERLTSSRPILNVLESLSTAVSSISQYPKLPLPDDNNHGDVGDELFGVLVGPEGGFGEGDFADALPGQLEYVSLGDNVLRAETAVIYALSVVSAKFP
jgi:16S rRNA (uracil1498-N3)-methyltransferase